jgi:hypothetical protein
MPEFGNGIRQTTDSMLASRFVTSPRWDQARWRATTFRWHPKSESPPILGLVFEGARAAQELFTTWLEVAGNEDAQDEIRLSIIEGDIPGQKPGYTVQICPNPQVVLAQAAAANIKVNAQTPLQLSRRFNRMHPLAGTPPLLPRFKQEYRQHKEFLLAPVTERAPGQFWFDVELGIVKRKIIFRQAREIGRTDIDNAALTSPQID